MWRTVQAVTIEGAFSRPAAVISTGGGGQRCGKSGCQRLADFIYLAPKAVHHADIKKRSQVAQYRYFLRQPQMNIAQERWQGNALSAIERGKDVAQQLIELMCEKIFRHATGLDVVDCLPALVADKVIIVDARVVQPTNMLHHLRTGGAPGAPRRYDAPC
ncbi:hypothetical protein D8L93_00140 [Sodalis-like symbiont of Bactericera trigonica]|nr:hypothetical protein D8L93_00140 [Sodalis-like symbiont of Bactericera trigonica]